MAPPALGLGQVLGPSALARAPEFLVERAPVYDGWGEALRTVLKRQRFPAQSGSRGVFRSVPVTAFSRRGEFQSVSLALHMAGILLLVYLPAASRAKEVTLSAQTRDTEKIYYRLTVVDRLQKLPRIAPQGEGAKPGKGDLVDKMPALGSTVQHRTLTVVSKPVRPDNIRQTIFQPAAPPDLRITTELKLPNIIEARPVVIPKPQVHFNPKDSKPALPTKQMVTANAPALKATNVTTPLTNLTEAANQPHLPVPAPSTPAAAPQKETAMAEAMGPSELESNQVGSGLVVISTDPGEASDMVALPMGNRLGDFSISPVGNVPGSPGGIAKGGSGVGTGGGAGGDSSTGVGAGNSGGGGGKLGSGENLSISGSGGGTTTTGALGPGVPLSMVYPVAASLLPRKNSLVVSAGPMGGGGLNIYGAFHCGKIYTVFLQMPGKAWALQYCQAGEAGGKARKQNSSTVVHLEEAMTPPDAEERFDFERVPLPLEKVHKLIVLKGLLREDGTVDNVQVHQGLSPVMDEAARLAFSQWKFKPAIRAGKAVAVDILVGIPSDAPPARPKT